MKNRIWPAIMVGAVAFLRTAEVLFWTNLDLPGITFWSMTAYVAGIAFTYAVTDRIRIKRVPARRQILITLGREERERGKKKERPA